MRRILGLSWQGRYEGYPMKICARLAARLLLGGAIVFAVILNAGDRAEAAAYAALVMDATTGRVLSQTQADAPRYPASLTKMMTLYMLFEALDSRKLKLTSRLKVSALAASRPPSKLGLRRNQTITVREAILALVTKSANDVATVVAERLAGSEARFAQKMTAKARAMGMRRTTFRNASGLPHRSQLTSARDMATLGRALLRRFPHYYGYFAAEAFNYGGARYANHNRLLGNYDGVDGIKTGYIHASGFNLVASAKRDGRRLIGVIFGARSPAERSYKMASLLDDGFDRLPPAPLTVVRMNPQRPTLTANPARTLVAAAVPSVAEETAPDATSNLRGLLIASADDAAALTLASKRAWGIQVGAFSALRSAQTRASKAAKLVEDLVADATIEVLTQPSARGDTIYLSRIHGLSQRTADAACTQLRSRQIGCFVVTLDEFASGPAGAALAAVGAGTLGREPEAMGDGDDAGDSSGGVAGGGWGVQVGVYPRRASALATAKGAVSKAPAILAAGTITVVPLKGRNGPLYRARILGLAKDRAYSACRTLEAANTPCMVLRMGNAGRERQAAAL